MTCDHLTRSLLSACATQLLASMHCTDFTENLQKTTKGIFMTAMKLQSMNRVTKFLLNVANCALITPM